MCALLLTASKCPSTKLPGSAWAGVAAAVSLGQGLTAPGWAEMWCWAVVLGDGSTGGGWAGAVISGNALRDLTKIDLVSPSGLPSLYMNLSTNTKVL